MPKPRIDPIAFANTVAWMNSGISIQSIPSASLPLIGVLLVGGTEHCEDGSFYRGIDFVAGLNRADDIVKTGGVCFWGMTAPTTSTFGHIRCGFSRFGS